MEQRFAFVNITSQKCGKPTIQFEQLHPEPSFSIHENHAIASFYTISQGGDRPFKSDSIQSSPDHGGHTKALSTCLKRRHDFIELLTGTPNGTPSGSNTLCHDPQRASVRGGETVIVVNEWALEPSLVGSETQNLYLPITFCFHPAGPEQPGIRSTQFLRVSKPTTSLQRTLSPGSSIEHIDILSGVCLFNLRLLDRSILALENDAADQDILSKAPITLNEADYIANSTSKVADIAAALIVKFRHHGPAVTICIRLVIPSFHYYPKALDRYTDGLCTAERVRGWMDAVDRRHDQLLQISTDMIETQMQQRGISASHYTIKAARKNNPFWKAVRHAVVQRRAVPSLDIVLQRLSNDEPKWHSFHNCLCEKVKAHDLNDLGMLSYVFENLTAALWPSTASNSSRLIISIDDPRERPLYTRTRECLRKILASRTDIPRTSLLVTYLCRRPFINGNASKHTLYNYDPMPERPVLVPSASVEGVGQEVGPLDVVKYMYGSEMARELERSMRAVGLSG